MTAARSFVQLMAEDILRERKRVGGDWIIAHVGYHRDTLRRVLGEDLRLVVLDISFDLLRERLAASPGRRSVALRRLMARRNHTNRKLDEPNTVTFEIKRGATKEENAKAVLDLINANGKNN